MTSKNKKVVIVGGVAGGASTAARLRRLEEMTEIIILERGEYVSFGNCGLPYLIGNVIKNRKKLELMTPKLFLKRFNIDVRVKNEATSIDRKNKRVHVKNLIDDDDYILDYDVLVLSPGAAPIVPPFKGLNDIPVFTLRTIPDSVKIIEFIDKNSPKNAVIVGGGFIGLEMAENLVERGIFVTIVELMDQVMLSLDKEMAQFVHQELYLNGVDLVLGDGVKSFSKSNMDKSIVHTQSGKMIETDLVILSIGIKPESKLAKEARLELGPKGHIVVNKNMQTSDPNIYAVGDAVQITDYITKEPTAVALAGPANKQGRIAANNITGFTTEYEGVLGSSVVKIFGLTVTQVGMNEKKAKKSGIKYEKIYVHPQNHAGYYPGAEPLTIKLLFELPNGKILGVQIVGGKGAEKRVDVISTVMYYRGTVFDLEKLELTYAPPYGSAKDPVNMAGFVASNVIRGDMKIWHWDEVDSIIKGNGLIVDVRTKAEFNNSKIAEAINISDLDLRNKLGDLPKDKPLYVYCRVGFRGYLAYRTLVQRGFHEVYNLTGGYKLYEIASISLENLRDLTGDPKTIMEQKRKDQIEEISILNNMIKIDACGLSCPGPLNSLIRNVKTAPVNSLIQITASDPGFLSSVKAFTSLTEGIDLVSLKKVDGNIISIVRKSQENVELAIDEEPEHPIKETVIKKEEPSKGGRIKPSGEPPVTKIESEELLRRLGKSNSPSLIIDVRPAREIISSGGKIPGSLVIPLNELMKSLYLIDENKQNEIITVCRSGMRSMMAAKLLARAGYKDIRSLEGGALNWLRLGFPLDKKI